MIFSELYSVYYHTVAKILSHMIDGEVSERELQKIVSENAFGESVMTILPALKSEKWQLMRPDMTTTLTHKPIMPLTALQKQWLKAISLDPRVQLFGVDFEGLDDVEPLFTSEDYEIYDRYGDGDPYEDEGYIERFRFLLSAIRKQIPIKLNLINKNGKNVYTKCVPVKLEYSEKDDKFRLLTSGCRFIHTVNLAKISSCSEYRGEHMIGTKRRETRHEWVTLKVKDERNALERVMLHFAHFEKQAEQIGRDDYLVRLKYDQNDEPEMVIRVLSFGPLVEVTEPQHFIELIKDRLRRQKNCNLR